MPIGWKEGFVGWALVKCGETFLMDDMSGLSKFRGRGHLDGILSNGCNGRFIKCRAETVRRHFAEAVI